ncbi:uncharacterized protein PV09_01848 [Verruconis gallopava]|uniref:Extracellular membrane protein CFEM domain-containing protein n=1 Tax=Verruconis gallopava TaxID=253628 RepID=A0A0D2AN52_9PEZI|nr:uncharacterized protein PV09_01848 [Verruconis gallopava]KIW07945.1 hypothetical protein PV09_01848 [Verruconis gallopava]
MKAIFALFIAAAAAQTTTSTALTPQQSCLNACAPSDVTCQAICVGVPHPGDAQMNSTTQCVAQCDQGDGSAAASEAYAKCRDGCISSYIILSGTAAPGGSYTTAVPPGVSTTAAAAEASGSAAGSAAATEASATASQTGTSASGSASAASSTSKNAGNSLAYAQYGVTGGLTGLFLGAFALL